MTQTHTALRAELTALLSLLREQAAQHTGEDFAFGSAVADSAEATLAALRTGSSELPSPEDTARKIALEAELLAWIGDIQVAHQYKLKDSEIPAWLRGHKKQRELFFAEVVARWAELPQDFRDWFEADSDIRFDSMAAKYADWQQLAARLAARSQLAEQYRTAVDTRALLVGSLRRYGLSTTAIRQAVQQAVGLA